MSSAFYSFSNARSLTPPWWTKYRYYGANLTNGMTSSSNASLTHQRPSCYSRFAVQLQVTNRYRYWQRSNAFGSYYAN